MPFRTINGVHFYQFETLGEGVIQAVFTRRGGFSPPPWATLNLGGTVGDDPERVRKNRQLALNSLSRDLNSVFDVWQVHGTSVVIAHAARDPSTSYLQADIILTEKPSLTLMMRFADCVPILLHDPVRKAIGIAHAGWMGTVSGVARIAVEAMRVHFGSAPETILAAIGPSIGPDHYVVGPDVISQVQHAFGRHSIDLLQEHSGNVHFDLWKANRLLLKQAGVQHIETAGLCTACSTDNWFSHRAEHGRTGRFGAIISLCG